MNRKNRSMEAHLHLEELESRSMLAAVPGVLPAAPDLTTGGQGSGTLPGNGFPAEVAASVAANVLGFPAGDLNFANNLNLQTAGVSAVGINTAANGLAQIPGVSIVLTGVDGSTSSSLFSRAPDANSGVGQMLLTTGANTPGLGSFATSTLGYASENGGRSGG
jgi:hypothetical protein